MFETWETQKRIDEAKRVTVRLVDHTHYLLGIHANNAVALYSDTLYKQIPKSYAANAFNVFREAMHQIEVVRICALWDQAHIDNETIPTVVELIDDQKVIDTLADQTRAQHDAPTRIHVSDDERSETSESIAREIQQVHREFGNKQAERAISSLKNAIQEARKIRKSERLTSIRNLRNKHVAHYLTQTAEEKKAGPIALMKHGDETPVLDASIGIVQSLYCWVNGVSLSFKDSQAIYQKCADGLWQACTFKIDARELRPT
jgi:hypothetical protein